MRRTRRFFDHLHAKMNDIERAFGGKLSWQRLDARRGCSIAHTISSGGYRSEESTWPEIQDAMIDSMIRLEAAMRPHVLAMKQEYAEPPAPVDHVGEARCGVDSGGEPPATLNRKTGSIQSLRSCGAVPAVFSTSIAVVLHCLLRASIWISGQRASAVMFRPGGLARRKLSTGRAGS